MENDDAESDFVNAETPRKSTVLENVDFAAGDGTQLKIGTMNTMRTQRQPKLNLCGMPPTSNKPEFDPFQNTGPMQNEHELITRKAGAVEPDHEEEVKLSWLPNEIWKLATDNAYLQAVTECQKEAQAKRNPIASAGRGRSKGFTDIFKPVVRNHTEDVATVTVVDDNASVELPVYSDDGDQNLDLNTTAEELWTETTAIESVGPDVSDAQDDLYFDNDLSEMPSSVVEPEQESDATEIFIEQFIRDLQAFKMDELIQRKQDEAIAEIKREKKKARRAAEKAAYKARKEARERRKLIRIQARHKALQQIGVQGGNDGSHGAGVSKTKTAASTNYSPQPQPPEEEEEETPIQVNLPAVFTNSNYNNTTATTKDEEFMKSGKSVGAPVHVICIAGHRYEFGNYPSCPKCVQVQGKTKAKSKKC